MDCSLPGSSVHGILQARILEWVHFLLQGICPTLELNPGLLHCRQILYWDMRELISMWVCLKKKRIWNQVLKPIVSLNFNDPGSIVSKYSRNIIMSWWDSFALSVLKSFTVTTGYAFRQTHSVINSSIIFILLLDTYYVPHSTLISEYTMLKQMEMDDLCLC